MIWAVQCHPAVKEMEGEEAEAVEVNITEVNIIEVDGSREPDRVPGD